MRKPRLRSHAQLAVEPALVVENAVAVLTVTLQLVVLAVLLGIAALVASTASAAAPSSADELLQSVASDTRPHPSAAGCSAGSPASGSPASAPCALAAAAAPSGVGFGQAATPAKECCHRCMLQKALHGTRAGVVDGHNSLDIDAADCAFGAACRREGQSN